MRAWRIHMNALREMVELRGGIDTVTSQATRISLYWMDVNGCCTEDLRPVWPVPTQWYSLRPSLPAGITLPNGAENIMRAWMPLCQDQQE
jgi:hypothetical protein